ncbi:MAG: methylated-DNA--[protein]-cysteine S-methyltransferase [Bradyrhizobiaceae bacterium]|nr:methylated-DNA--[protein]-cysteine S-methyltransferase [Bradyrhizobiaceae bacterium]
MSEPAALFTDRLATPIGDLLIVADEAGRLRALKFEDRRAELRSLVESCRGVPVREAANPGGLTAALQAYFDGDLTAIDGLPVATSGTPFQESVWRALRTIPCGETLSYGGLARQIGRPSAVRAVGLANGANPVAVVVPCHRVIGSDGSLTGYGGGIERKRWLLAHERAGATPLLNVLP